MRVRAHAQHARAALSASTHTRTCACADTHTHTLHPLAAQYAKGTVLYKVLWADYGPEAASWQPAVHISEGDIDEYEARLRKEALAEAVEDMSDDEAMEEALAEAGEDTSDDRGCIGLVDASDGESDSSD